jgi:hypothetical protein
MAQHTRLSEKEKGRPGWTASHMVITDTTDLFRRNRPDHYQRSRPLTLFLPVLPLFDHHRYLYRKRHLAQPELIAAMIPNLRS